MIAGKGTWCVTRTLPDGTRKVMLRDTERQTRQSVARCLMDNGLTGDRRTASMFADLLVPGGDALPFGGYTFRLTRGTP